MKRIFKPSKKSPYGKKKKKMYNPNQRKQDKYKNYLDKDE